MNYVRERQAAGMTLACFLALAAAVAGLAQAPTGLPAPTVLPSPSEVAPPPRLIDLPGPDCPESSATGTRPLGAPPRPSEETVKQFSQFVEQTVDPTNTLDMVVGQPRLLVFKDAPVRIQLPDDTIASYTVISPRELSVLGKKVGTSVLNLWFTDPKDPKKQIILSYLLRVLPDPLAKSRIEAQLKELQDEINRAFCDSVVCLKLVGDKVVLTGQAKDVVEAAEIVRIIGTNTRGMGGQTSGTARSAVQAAQAPTAAPVPAQPAPTPGTPETTAQPGAPETPTTENYVVPSFPNVINLLRIPGEQQVMLKVVVAEVNRDAARSIGLNFFVNNDKGQTVFAQETGPLGGNLGGAVQGTGQARTGGINLPFTLDNGKIPVQLNALRSLDLARTLAEPDLVTLNGKPANFQAGGSFPVPVLTGTGLTVASGVQFVQFGVQLRFTPIITDKDRVRLQVSANVSALDPSIGTTINGNTPVSGLNTRNFSTTVEMREGQTLAVAGLVRNDFLSSSQRVPGLGDLPVLSRLWSVNRTSHAEQELVMLVTPVLVHPLDPKQTPPLPGADVFEPGDLEFYLLGRMESRRAYDYRSAARTDFARMVRYRNCENIFILGPHGYSDGK